MTRKEKFLEIYYAAHNNAEELLSDAEMLFNLGKYARAYFLAFTALEEISKSQLAADVYTGFIREEDFWDNYDNHKRKVGRMASIIHTVRVALHRIFEVTEYSGHQIGTKGFMK